jgi:hypothetical protein
MKLPNAHLAIVDREKVTKYLLNPAHPDNGGKAAFFTALGFEPGAWPVFAQALRGLAETGIVKKTVDSVHGRKYIVDGQIEPALGTPRAVRSVWIVDRGSQAPRVVTAYPHEEGEQSES